MPRPGPRKPLLGVRVSVEGIKRLDARAARATELEGTQVNRSEMVRRMLRYAEHNMPERYKSG